MCLVVEDLATLEDRDLVRRQASELESTWVAHAKCSQTSKPLLPESGSESRNLWKVLNEVLEEPGMPIVGKLHGLYLF